MANGLSHITNTDASMKALTGKFSSSFAATQAISPTSFKVLILAQNNRFVQFSARINTERNRLILTQASCSHSGSPVKLSSNTISHDLDDLRVTSIDTETERLICPAKRHFGMKLTTNTGYRKLFFPSHD